MTGEVDQLERGQLQFKTDHMGTLEIEWDKIVSITAAAPFDIDDIEGRRYVGSLQPGPKPGEILVVSAGGTQVLTLLNVVRIRRLGTTFWKRLDGSVDLGASYASASQLFTLNFSGSLRTERAGFELSLNGDSTVTTQPGADDTQRNDLTLTYVRRFKNRWVALAQAIAQQNRELGFDLRSGGAAGGGRYLVLGRRNKLLAVLGLSVNREKPVDGETSTNTEIVTSFTYDLFGYDFPKVSVSMVANGFVSVSEWGRHRAEFSGQAKRELIKDLYISIRGYESYDNRPPTEGSPKNDYGATFAFGWSF